MAGKGLDEAVLSTLKFGGLSDDGMDHVVRIVSELDEVGARPVRVFPKGLPSDGAWVEVLVDTAGAGSLITKLGGDDRIDELRMWGIGLPAVDQILARVGVR